MKHLHATLAGLALALITSPAAAKDEPPQLVKCETSIGTIALIDSDAAGWTKWGLGSPRQLINQLAIESGCFTPHDPSSAEPARFLITAVAGTEEEVDQGVEIGKAVATEALVRSGAAGAVLGSVPFGGAALGLFGGLGGKKKTVAAGIRLISPATGQTLISGTGDVTKTSITLGGIGGGLQQGAAAAGYGGSKDGQMLVEAFIKAFNALSAQSAGLPQVAAAAPAAATPASAATAVDTRMYASADKNSSVLRTLRAGTSIKPTGKRQGLFVEAEDGFGTKGWVSVEDLK